MSVKFRQTTLGRLGFYVGLLLALWAANVAFSLAARLPFAEVKEVCLHNVGIPAIFALVLYFSEAFGSKKAG